MDDRYSIEEIEYWLQGEGANSWLLAVIRDPSRGIAAAARGRAEREAEAQDVQSKLRKICTDPDFHLERKP